MHKSILQYLCKITGTCVLVGLGLKRTFALVVVLLYYYNTTLCCVLYCTIIIVIVVLYCSVFIVVIVLLFICLFVCLFVCLFICLFVHSFDCSTPNKRQKRTVFCLHNIVKFLTNSRNKRQATCLVSKWLSSFFSFYFLIFIVLTKNCPFILIDIAPPNSVLPAVPKH